MDGGFVGGGFAGGGCADGGGFVDGSCAGWFISDDALIDNPGGGCAGCFESDGGDDDPDDAVDGIDDDSVVLTQCPSELFVSTVATGAPADEGLLDDDDDDDVVEEEEEEEEGWL